MGDILKILVTGGAGFIGSAVIRHIMQNTNNHVLNIDKLTYAGNFESLKEIDQHSNYEFKQIDICDTAANYSCNRRISTQCYYAFGT